MPVEHRLYQRQPTQVCVELTRAGQSIGIARAVNTSAGGMAIENAGLGLHYGARVDATVVDEDANSVLPRQFRALVIHATADSAGLMWVGLPGRVEIKLAS